MDNAALLDQLMGRERNMTASQRNLHTVSYSDASQCHYYLVQYCPHELFPNTRIDLGACKKEHNPAARNQFQQLSHDHRDYQLYLSEWYYEVGRIVSMNDRLVMSGKSRVNRDYQEIDKHPEVRAVEDKVTTITSKIQTLLDAMEKLGEEGKLDEINVAMKEVKELEVQKSELQKELRTVTQLHQPELLRATVSKQRNIVCDVCGSLLLENEVEERTQAHLTGKQHTGMEKLRTSLEEFKSKMADMRSSAPASSAASAAAPSSRYDPPRRDSRDRYSGSRDRTYQSRDRDYQSRDRNYQSRDQRDYRSDYRSREREYPDPDRPSRDYRSDYQQSSHSREPDYRANDWNRSAPRQQRDARDQRQGDRQYRDRSPRRR